MSLTLAVKAEAHRLGFHQAGICTAEPPPHFAAFERWLAAGYHGEMHYLADDRARQRRADPRLILPKCKSILVLAIHYPPPAPPPAATPVTLEIISQHTGNEAGLERAGSPPTPWATTTTTFCLSAYSALVVFIENQAGHPVPQPLVHRYRPAPGARPGSARRPGLDWQEHLPDPSQNGLLFPSGRDSVGPRAGTRSTLRSRSLRHLHALPRSLPHPLYLPAIRCPDRTIDARRCISYLTIELKGRHPRASCAQLAGRLGLWLRHLPAGLPVEPAVCLTGGRSSLCTSL